MSPACRWPRWVRHDAVAERRPAPLPHFTYEVRWDGPLRHQPEEVVWGDWVTSTSWRRLADRPGWPFVPDGRVGVERWLAPRGRPLGSQV